MKWLQSKKRFNDIARYDENSGEYEIVSRTSPDRPEVLDGSFSMISGVFMALFKNGNNLSFVIGDKTYQLEDDIVVTLKAEKTTRLLIIKKGNVVMQSVNYMIPGTEKVRGDTTAFIDNEDSDYGLFLSNVANDKARQRVLLGID